MHIFDANSNADILLKMEEKIMENTVCYGENIVIISGNRTVMMFF
jgi:hypothetical protein